jgi:D-ornithine 4,5-aminomutase subunit beta
VPWHIYNIEACDTAKQTLLGMDGLMDMVELKKDGPLRETARELKERAVLFFEEILAAGGYFNAVEQGFFVDSGIYPERNGDGIFREINGGVGVGTVFERAEDYMAPVTAHYGYNNVAQYDESAVNDPAKLIGGCTFENPDKIIYIDELDEEDNVNVRMAETAQYRGKNCKTLKPEMEWLADGIVMVNLFFPTSKRIAEAAAIEVGRRMGLQEVEVISREIMQEAEGTRVEIKGRVGFDLDIDHLEIPEEPHVLTDAEIRADIERKPMTVVCGTIGNDEHSVGLREIIDIKHGGIEKYGIKVHYLGTSVPVEKLVSAAVEVDADAILASTIISHDDIHYKNIANIDRLAREMGVRDKLIFIAGGTQITPELAVENGADAGFGRGTKGIHDATFLVERRRELEAAGKWPR